ncbi:helix-hairpin-helix domain-containing protein [Chryseobacterium sp. JAH]|uniref:helix-hairpin-helix domain-containing protein n=1 Tax=Chryseobacterium sp. JAH TaxID=1742858 RepID=UPI001E3A4636|nr:helix-hairpin-helix domain-containing protein [Chryseobacterium sp. JAH]
MAKYISPVCNDQHEVSNDFLKGVIAMPARRMLEREKIDSLDKLADYSEEELMQFHGFGKSTVQRLKIYMKDNHFSFKSSLK